MKILIDADGCPVIDIAISVGIAYNIQTVIFCDTAHQFNKPQAKTVTVSSGPDSVDFAIVNYLSPRDIVITQDYGLAAMCLAKKAIPIDQNGMVYSDDNIDSLLMSRHISKQIRLAGGRTKGPKKRNIVQDNQFQKCLTNIIQEALQ